MIDSDDVFNAIRRGYTEFNDASSADILEYFSAVDESSVSGHVSNIKGIMFEQIVVEGLKQHSLDAELFDKTNHPVSDIIVYVSDHELLGELQLKATDSVSYVSSALEHNPDVPIITTSEVADYFDNNLIINSGIENSYLNDVVMSTVFYSGSDISDQVSTEYIGASDISSEIVSGGVGEFISDDISESIGEGVSESIGEGVSESIGEGVSESIGEGVADSVLGESISEGLADSVLDAVTSIPLSPTGLALKLLFALF